MEQLTRQLPDMPVIGQPEIFYAKIVRNADQHNDIHLHEGAKVGQYVTLALDHNLDWPGKLKYFRHAIKRHCNPPLYPDDAVWMYYKNLAELVREHAGFEALRLCSQEDDNYATRVSMGQDREALADEAEQFFSAICGNCESKPEWFNEDDWTQIKMIRDQWI